MDKIRVLVVDDAIVVRRVLTEVLAADPDVDVVGAASNGRMALTKIEQLQPDLVVLDVEMPELDGLATLRELRRLRPTLPVIMFSVMTRRGAVATVEALTLGANDYVPKPPHDAGGEEAAQQVRAELLPKVKALGRRAPTTLPVPRAPRAPLGSPVHVLAIGCSTGGPNALATLMPLLPAELPVPVVIVQHMPRMFTGPFAERLDRISAVEVREGTAGAPLRGGTAYLAPGDFHMRVQAGMPPSLQLDQGEPRHSCRPAVDVLFESCADLYGPGVLGVVLTGMGHDGLRGSERIRQSGGTILVQDEATSVVWGMPGVIAKRGLATEILPLEQLADAILRRILGEAGMDRRLQRSGSR